MQRFCHRNGVGIVVWRQSATPAAAATMAPRDNHRRIVTRGRRGRVAVGFAASGTSTVASDISASYNILGAVVSDLAAAYAILSASAVQANLACAYAVRGLVQADHAASYTIRAAVAADAVGSYIVRGAVAVSLTGAYIVDGGAAFTLTPGKRRVVSNRTLRTVTP